MRHALVKLAQRIDWAHMSTMFGAVYKDCAGRPPLPTRLMVGLAIIKHMDNLSDEDLTERWVRDPYYQYLCGEEFFQHKAPFDRSSLTRWRQRMGEERLAELVLESLRIAHATKALSAQDLQRVVADTTVQPKNIAHPTDHRLLLKALEKLTKLAKKEGLPLRQSYARVAKLASIKTGRYINAKQFKRARRVLKFLRTRLGRVIRDIRRQLDKRPWLEDKFHDLMMLVIKVKHQEQRQRGQKVFALHAPEVECIGKGKARTPYEFGCKVSVVTPVTKPKGDSLSRMPKRITAIPMMATCFALCWRKWKSVLGSALNEALSTRATKATPIRTSSKFGSRAKRKTSQKPSNAR